MNKHAKKGSPEKSRHKQHHTPLPSYVKEACRDSDFPPRVMVFSTDKEALDSYLKCYPIRSRILSSYDNDGDFGFDIEFGTRDPRKFYKFLQEAETIKGFSGFHVGKPIYK